MERQKIGYEIRAVSNLIKRKVFELDGGNQGRHAGMRGHIIGFLYDHREEEIFQRDLEAEFSVRRSTVSRFLTAMEEQGLLVRQPVPQDARLKKLTLTPKAIAEHEQIMVQLQKVEEAVSQGMSPEEIREFLRILRKIKQNLS